MRYEETVITVICITEGQSPLCENIWRLVPNLEAHVPKNDVYENVEVEWLPHYLL